MDEERPTLAQLKALRVVDLRERLASLGLDTKGVKAILVDRLDEYYSQLEDDQPIGEAEEEGDDIEEVEDEEKKK